MKKSVFIFLIAVLLPSAILGWLALSNAQEQQIILERRTAELYQSEVDNSAAAIRAIIDDQRRAFAETVRQLLTTQSPDALARNFAPALAEAWTQPAVGFSLDRKGNILSPSAQQATALPDRQDFLRNNSDFICNQITATVFPVAVETLNLPDTLRKSSNYEESKQRGYMSGRANPQSKPEANAQAKLDGSADKLAERRTRDDDSKLASTTTGLKSQAAAPAAAPPSPSAAFAKDTAQQQAIDKDLNPGGAKVAMSKRAEGGQAKKENQPSVPNENPDSTSYSPSLRGGYNEATTRNVAPQQVLDQTDRAAYSQLTWANGGFQELTTDKPEGMITRFVQDKLEMILWLRPEQAPGRVFGCRIDANSLRDLWPLAFPDITTQNDKAPEFLVTLLNDKAQPVTNTAALKRTADWKRPFVASEIGEVLPHWEVALYLMRPEQLRENAKTVRRTFALLVATALGAIACGGWLVVADARRQLALAQQKTDFVSNVSHELKTPLTSIRMFAELMQSGRADASRHSQYLRIIMVESERLTRLINNVLDFAKLGRSRQPLSRARIDLHQIIARTWEGQQIHLQENGFETTWQAATPPYPIYGDEDAIAQILVNLLSNAEKYSGAQKVIELHSYLEGQWVCVSVLDRGTGIPAGEERKIFEPFYRAHDSLASGIQGSGLGLTLSLRHARELGGDILCQARADGGTRFTLRLPLADPAVLP